jgi:two-component system sensor histidine kinase UhpB
MTLAAALRPTSLRARVLGLVGLVLLVGFLAGVLLAGWEARRTLHAEFHGGLEGASRSVATAFEDLPRSDHRERDLAQLVWSFDGSRHVRAELVDRTGRTLAASRPLKASRVAPGWFAPLLGAPPASVRLAAPGVPGETVVLHPVMEPDVAAVWAEVSGVVLALGASALVGMALVWVAISAALKPLRDLGGAFVRIGQGDYEARVAEQGAAELADLQNGFNAMAARLAAMEGRNRVLEQQLMTLQDEERADIARDLHDEIGPHLFAVNIDAQMIGRLAGSGREAEIGEQVKSIQAAVGHMQRQVRDLLSRLRPTRATELGLNAALADLVAFWRGRCPEVTFVLDVEAQDGALPEPLGDVVYRVVQESLNNAARHARASRVAVCVALTPDAVTVVVADDGLERAPRGDAPGFGLIGMRERVRASGGTLAVDTDAGWKVTARLPLPQAAAPAEQTEAGALA